MAWREDYPRWVSFYRGLVREMSQSERDALVEADFGTQTGAVRHRNSPLRIWCKVFYTVGA